jgi:hypothetical protein
MVGNVIAITVILKLKSVGGEAGPPSVVGRRRARTTYNFGTEIHLRDPGINQ